jgi:DNA-binding response OmpR family regulator
VQETQPALVILDVMLPHKDGLDLCREIRAAHGPPVIMLTARGEPTDIVLALGLGADDYVTKPFSPAELVARVKAILRRTASSTGRAPQEVIRIADLEIDTARRRVRCAGTAIELRAREFDLLAHLAAHAGRVYTRQQLLHAIWGYDAPEGDGTVTVHVRRVREKVERDPARPHYITTVWGVGYRFDG